MNTCARRWSSLSITARSSRYTGSGALMMSELVAGSAWICPPVDGWLPAAALMLGPVLRLPPPVPLAPLPWLATVSPPLPWTLTLPPPPLTVTLPPGVPACPGSAAIAARKVTASLVASAFFR